MSIFPDNQRQNVGDHSVAIQVDGNLSIGLGYKDVKDICIDLLHENFPKLRDAAMAEANQHVTAYANNLMKRLADENKELLNKRLSEPGVQFAINQTVQQVARKTTKAKVEVLQELIVGKIRTIEEEKEILIDEAIELTSKLSSNQIKFLALVCFIRNSTKLVGNQDVTPILSIEDENEVMVFENGKTLTRKAVNEVYKDEYKSMESTLLKITEGVNHDIKKDQTELNRRGFISGIMTYNIPSLDIFKMRTGIKELKDATLENELEALSICLRQFSLENISDLDLFILSDISSLIASSYLISQGILKE